MSNPTNKVLYKEDLGVNFNGNPLEFFDSEEAEELAETLLENQMIRMCKNIKYELVVEIRAVDTAMKGHADEEPV